MKQTDLVKHLDNLLKSREFKDSSQNGLQVDGSLDVRKVAFAVDACLASFKGAVKAGAQMLVVHHGMFWDKPVLPTGTVYRRLKVLFDAHVGLYACHLPLDAHPTLGNNAELCRLLGLRKRRAFGEYHGQRIGFGGDLPAPLTMDQLAERLRKATGDRNVRVFAHGPTRVKSVGCISGGAAGQVEQSQRAGFDAYVTGEGGHGNMHDFAERGANVLLGGHYATETLGVKALQAHLARKLKLTTVFIDLPTGM
jgi:dinuclear metal center YbgI/SA1388 family protein